MAQRLYELDRSAPWFLEQLNELLHDEEWVYRLRLLPRGELAELIDYLDDVRCISTPTEPYSPSR